MMTFFVCINILDIGCVCVCACAYLVFGYPSSLVIFLWYVILQDQMKHFISYFHLWNKVLHHLQEEIRSCTVYIL